jgi:hypothetical protein
MPHQTSQHPRNRPPRHRRLRSGGPDPELKSAPFPGQRVGPPAPSAAPGLSARRRFTAAILGIAIGLLAVALSAGLGLLLASAIFGYGGLG